MKHYKEGTLIEFTPKSKLTHTPIENPKRINLFLPESDFVKLRNQSILYNTTVSEIIRVLVSEYLKTLDSGKEER